MPKEKKSKDGFINEWPPKRQKIRMEISRVEKSSNSPASSSPTFLRSRRPESDKVKSPDKAQTIVHQRDAPLGVQLDTSWKYQPVKGTSRWETKTVSFDKADTPRPTTLSSKPVEKTSDDPTELGISYGPQEERESACDSGKRVATVSTDQRKKKRKRTFTDNETDLSSKTDCKHETDDIGDLVQMLTPAYNDRERKKRIKIDRVGTTDLDPVVHNCRKTESKGRATSKTFNIKPLLLAPNWETTPIKSAVKDGNCHTDTFSRSDKRDKEEKNVMYSENSVDTPVRYRHRMDSMDRVKWRGDTLESIPAGQPKDVCTPDVFRGDTTEVSPTVRQESKAKHGLIPSVLLRGRPENVFATRTYSPFVRPEGKDWRNRSFSPSACNESPKDRVDGSAMSPLLMRKDYDARRVDYSGISPSAWCTPKAREGRDSAVFSPSVWPEDKDERIGSESSPSVLGADNLENLRRTSLSFKEDVEYEKFILKGVELVGDSMLLRLFNQLTGSKPSRRSEPINSRIALTVSGQRLGQVLYKLKSLETSHHLPTSKTILLMLGTNDILRHTALPIMQQQLRSVIHLLSTNCTKIVVMTIPPIPLLDGPSGELDRVKLMQYNHFIRMGVEGGRCSVFDPFALFLEGDTANRDLFESSMGYGMYLRPDWIHWNTKGMLMVHDELCKAGVFC